MTDDELIKDAFIEAANRIANEFDKWALTDAYKYINKEFKDSKAPVAEYGTIYDPLLCASVPPSVLRKTCPQCHPKYKDYLRADEGLCWRCGRTDLVEV